MQGQQIIMPASYTHYMLQVVKNNQSASKGSHIVLEGTSPKLNQQHLEMRQRELAQSFMIVKNQAPPLKDL